MRYDFALVPFSVNKPRHKKPVFVYAKTNFFFFFFAYAKTEAHISAFVFATQIVQSIFFLRPNFKLLAIFCDCTVPFVSNLVGNPEKRFSFNLGQIR